MQKLWGKIVGTTIFILFYFPNFSQSNLSFAQQKNAPVFKLPSINNQTLLEQESKRKTKQSIPHFAHPFAVNITPHQDGIWMRKSENDWLWQLDLLSEGAKSINLGFEKYRLAGDAQLHIIDGRSGQVLSTFTAANNDSHQQFYTPIFKTDVLKLQLSVSDTYRDAIQVEIAKVNHGFIDFQKSHVSDACHIDVNCGLEQGFTEIENYQNQIQSVGIITIEGIGFCTGTLINNTNNDFRPYFLTAEHCNITNNNVASVVVYWNYENSTCRTPNSTENQEAGDGQFAVYNSGATIRAKHNPSDMLLLELDDPIPSKANAFFAGWDTSWEQEEKAICIHHPNGEEKRISFSFESLERANHFSEPDENGNHWRVKNWNLGSTQNGSSGAALFNYEGKIIGQLHGGIASCEEGGSDWFGALATAWDGDGTPNSQLGHWLSPNSTEVSEWHGIALEQVTPLSMTATIEQNIACFGGNNAVISLVPLGGTPPYQYSQDGIKYQEENTFSNLYAGNYTFFVQDATGLITTSTSLEIDQPSPLTIDYTANYNEITVEAFGGTPPYSYSLDNENYTDFGVFVFFDQGVRAIYVKDKNNCIFAREIEVVWSELLVDSRITKSIDCYADSTGMFDLIFEGGVPPYGVFLENEFISSISNKEQEISFENQTAGLYDFMIVDSALDTQFYSVNLEQPAPIVIDLEIEGNQITVSASGGEGELEYSIDNDSFQVSSTFSDLENGFYEVFVRDENDCTVSDTTNIFVVSNINIANPSVSFYPNPLQEELYILFSEENICLEQISIFDTAGKFIYKARKTVCTSQKITNSNWAVGTYVIYYQCDSKWYAQKIIKK